MARLPPLWQQNSLYPADADRGLITTLWPDACTWGQQVYAAGGTMNVGIPVGATAVPVVVGNVARGSFLCRNDTLELVTLQTPPPTGQSRFDRIFVTVRDSLLMSGVTDNDWYIQVVTGAAAATPAEPPAPGGPFPNTASVELARITVPGGVVNLNTATVLDRRVPMPRLGAVENAKLPRGIIAADRRTSALTNIGATGLAVVTLPSVTFEAGRRYRIWACWRGVIGSVLNDVLTFWLSIGGMAGPNIKETLVQVTSTIVGHGGNSVQTVYSPTANATTSVQLNVVRVAGSGLGQVLASTIAGEALDICVEDIGTP